MKHPDENENKMIENNVGHDGEYPCETRETQQQKCRNAMSIANRTPNDDSNGENQHQIKTQSKKSELSEYIKTLVSQMTTMTDTIEKIQSSMR